MVMSFKLLLIKFFILFLFLHIIDLLKTVGQFFRMCHVVDMSA